MDDHDGGMTNMSGNGKNQGPGFISLDLSFLDVEGESSRQSFPLKLSVKDDVRSWEVEFLDESASLGCTEFAIHIGVFPFNAEWSFISDFIKRPLNRLEIDTAAT